MFRHKLKQVQQPGTNLKTWAFCFNMKIDRIIKIQLIEDAAMEADLNDNAMYINLKKIPRNLIEKLKNPLKP
uniref:Uncharacterized protein n=1 Tax=Sphaerodactylus townsendi TaxID=933632 RepID=A0ACB8FUQ0_9SAUR